jgi:hypothetical protein
MLLLLMSIIAPAVRLRGIIIASDAATSGTVVTLKTTSSTGATLFHRLMYQLET